MRSKLLLVTLVILCATIALSFEKVKDLRLDADGIQKIGIDCGAGSLKVIGQTSSKTIEVTAEIVKKGKDDKDADEYIRDNVILRLERKGSKAVLISKFKNKLFSGNRSINLTVNVPKNIDIDVKDSSGEMSIQNITGDIYVDDLC